MSIRKLFMFFAVIVAAVFLSTQVMAEPVTINWWHAMKGARGKVVDTMIKAFNDSQSDYVVVGTYKGNYDETVNAGVAAYRAKKQPHLLQSFEVGTQTMMLSGAIYPVYKLMNDAGYD
ncbi:MAG: sn-glycerol-3-phosphate ABC transporter substrate-binding protein UgpB, partial [Deltaproteobacteria bacterium]|nr:sn-glycerol-3-phosphate ABC transporter substrate-binding protein UgpB [Deltaproteobacteria bacterium]